MDQSRRRYSDTELDEFRVLVESKLTKAREQLELLQREISEAAENGESDYGIDYIDDSTSGSSMTYLSEMLSRQQKYVQALESALIRIRNKTYGICSLTGEMIDKRRLMAVPTTTKSILAKADPNLNPDLRSVGYSSNELHSEPEDTENE